MNLVINAAEAMGEHMGPIVVRTGRRQVSRQELSLARVGAYLPAESTPASRSRTGAPA